MPNLLEASLASPVQRIDAIQAVLHERGLQPCMLKFGEFGVNAGFCFGKLFTARTAFEFIARASAHGVNGLPFILKPNSCLLADFGPRICKDGV